MDYLSYEGTKKQGHVMVCNILCIYSTKNYVKCTHLVIILAWYGEIETVYVARQCVTWR
jgi:hypothetical protein